MTLPQLTALRDIIAQIRRGRLYLVSLTIVGAYVAVTIIVLILGYGFLPYDPYEQNLASRLSPPSFTHLLGTDELGRDIFSRILAGAPYDFLIGLTVVVTSSLLGMALGIVAGYFGGILDETLMRITDIFLSFPPLVLAMSVSIALGPGVQQAILALLVVWWPWYARLSRAEALTLKGSLFVEAARLSGFGGLSIIYRHVLPHVLPTVIAYGTIDLGNAILTASVLSYVGLGVQPPFPEWGRMTLEGQDFLSTAWWYPLAPGFALFTIALAFSLLGDSFRDYLDPRLRHIR
ncbi:MAG: D-ala-D-ala transporter subunit [Nitrososphaerota archaeon]